MINKIKINNSNITLNSKTYFIADIAANHDGNLARAKKLIKLCAKAGANAAIRAYTSFLSLSEVGPNILDPAGFPFASRTIPLFRSKFE